MPAYMIITAKIHDRDQFIAGYGKAAAELVTRFGGRYVFRGGAPAELLEGQWGAGAAVLISEWPDLDTLHRFWNSEEYAGVKKLREGLADVQVLAVGSSGFASHPQERSIP
jgi:uncharacterized protein (DUF1330 family)